MKSGDAPSSPVGVLDARQLSRIESVHRGFLYQHIYGVACLLSAQGTGALKVVIEKDEDVELVFSNEHIYVQVKTRCKPLIPSDITDALDRFDKVRRAHAKGEREGSAAFRVVSNVPPGPLLRKLLGEPEWARDVTVAWPRCPPTGGQHVPPAWEDLEAALEWCRAQASALPFCAVSPETLVLKLAGCVMQAASGTLPGGGHEFRSQQLSRLFEQVTVPLQRFPGIPSAYRPLPDAPVLKSDIRVRLISAFSGAGKTAWASEAAHYLGGCTNYFDVADLVGPAVITSLARELAAHMLAGVDGAALGQVLMPGNTGVQMLHILDSSLPSDGTYLVVIDNAQRLDPETARRIADGTNHIQVVFLAQPGPQVREIVVSLGLAEESLPGWNEDIVADEVRELGAQADYRTCEMLIRLTGGLPLYVQNALQLACGLYAGDVSAFCADVVARTNPKETAQEVILSRVVGNLPEAARDALAVLSVADCPLSRDEAASLLRATVGMSDTSFAQALRELERYGLATFFGDGQFTTHDAVRVIGIACGTNRGDKFTQEVYNSLKELIQLSLTEKQDVRRLALFVRLLALTGDIATLTEFARDEMFHQFGLALQYQRAVERASEDKDLPPEERFWAFDALLFFDLNDGSGSRLEEYLQRMQRLVDEGGLPHRTRQVIGMRRLMLLSRVWTRYGSRCSR